MITSFTPPCFLWHRSFTDSSSLPRPGAWLSWVRRMSVRGCTECQFVCMQNARSWVRRMSIRGCAECPFVAVQNVRSWVCRMPVRGCDDRRDVVQKPPPRGQAVTALRTQCRRGILIFRHFQPPTVYYRQRKNESLAFFPCAAPIYIRGKRTRMSCLLEIFEFCHFFAMAGAYSSSLTEASMFRATV